MKKIELISFKLCPFVQRSVITLLKKGVEFKITYVDLANKPDWFFSDLTVRESSCAQIRG